MVLTKEKAEDYVNKIKEYLNKTINEEDTRFF